jgi:hypothetical protein
MFTPTMPVVKSQTRPPPTKERKSITNFIQVCQKPFFNQRVPSFTGHLKYSFSIKYYYMYIGASDTEYKERVTMLARTIRHFLYGSDDEKLRYCYHMENDVESPPVFIQHKPVDGKVSVYCCFASCSVCVLVCDV